MRDYDLAFCVAATGKLNWIHTTDAAVRVAPTIAGGKVYFSSDDGHAYCLGAEDGRLPALQCTPSANSSRLVRG